MSLQKWVFSHVNLKAPEPLIKQIWKILKHTAKGKQSRVFLEHKLAGGKGHSIDRLQRKGTSFSGNCKQKPSFVQNVIFCNICELKNALQQWEKVKKWLSLSRTQKMYPVPIVPTFPVSTSPTRMVRHLLSKTRRGKAPNWAAKYL